MEQAKELYILFTDTGTLLSKLIKSYTKIPLNHASISFDANLQEVYSFGRKSQGNPFLGGFVRENLYSPLFQEASCAVYRCTVSHSSYVRIRAQIREFEQNQERYKYNLIGLFGVMLQLEWEREDRFFCSQFVASVLENGGVKLVDKPPVLVTPADLQQTGMLMQVYSGSLNEYLGHDVLFEKGCVQTA
ncbi:hypothetical protein [Paenibacillus sp. HB172176]|uniref:hypothetical protein n=1 Tax=Paenibacillus sp. HB172176 TaxID=2493690 RepID=UPI00143CB799|nr:hypothetical protein [Paenibacillus sp. HB172176]